ncbi:MAG: XdhC family protein [Proteobacteria bacterium]|nr:XdhC family protein [Pseudomonadota bacterium]
MKRELLGALVAAQQRKQPAVLVRGLTTGKHCVLTREESLGDMDDIDPDVVDVARAALDSDGTRIVEADGERYLLQTLASKPRMLIVGAVHIAQSLIPMAMQAGYEIILIDPRTAFANPERFPNIRIDNRWPHEAMSEFELDARTAIVALSHDPKIDEPALQAAMDSNVFYIGALGSRGNHAKRLKRLAALGYSKAQLSRVHGPIGLSLGGRSPAEIAVAILAQVIQSRHQPTSG